jgi:hypothetical protein
MQIRTLQDEQQLHNNEIKKKTVLIEDTNKALNVEKENLLIAQSKNTKLTITRDLLLSKLEIIPGIFKDLSDDFVINSGNQIRRANDKLAHCEAEHFWLEATEKLQAEIRRRQIYRKKVKFQQERNLADEESNLLALLQDEETNAAFLKSCADALQRQINEWQTSAVGKKTTPRKTPIGINPPYKLPARVNVIEPTHSLPNKNTDNNMGRMPHIVTPQPVGEMPHPMDVHHGILERDQHFQVNSYSMHTCN